MEIYQVGRGLCLVCNRDFLRQLAAAWFDALSRFAARLALLPNDGVGNASPRLGTIAAGCNCKFERRCYPWPTLGPLGRFDDPWQRIFSGPRNRKRHSDAPVRVAFGVGHFRIHAGRASHDFETFVLSNANV